MYKTNIKHLMCLLNEGRNKRKINDCIELSFNNVLLHTVTQNNMQRVALIEDSIPNYMLIVVYNNK